MISHNHDHHDNLSTLFSTTNNSTSSSNRMEAYLFGTISILIVSLLSLVGAIILPFINNKNIYRGSILFFMSIAVGTMTSDAVLHLIPEILSLHSHEQGHHENENEHNHEHEENEKSHNEKSYIGHMTALLASLYFLFIFEMFSTVAANYCKTLSAVVADAAHGHSHGKPPSHSHSLESPASLELRPPNKPSTSPSSSPVPARPENLIFGLKPVAFVILISDGLHNFADGLAVGAAFMASSASGLATSIAIVCHELPHEVGDFAILLNSGLSVKKALFLNFLSALTAFAGLYIGIEAGQLESVRKWIFAAVAGGFLYVALVHMLHEIKDSAASLPWHTGAVLYNAGLLLGFTVILLLALYEEHLG